MFTLILAAFLNSTPVEVRQLSSISYECVCRSDEATEGFDCSEACHEATQEYIRTHEATPAESCAMNPDNCVDVEKIQ
jgi:hypothetical protein